MSNAVNADALGVIFYDNTSEALINPWASVRPSLSPYYLSG